MLEDYPRILDLLRNEGPVYVYFSPSEGDDRKGVTWFGTGLEEVGEGELPWQ